MEIARETLCPFNIITHKIVDKVHEAPFSGVEPWKRLNASEQVELSFDSNAVASDATACGILGAYVLNLLNGNAMDAAVSTSLCIGAANPQSAGIGGGSMLMHYDGKTKATTTFNYREKAPSNASRDMYNGLAKDASVVGGLAIGVPGEVRGLALAHSRHGRLPWKSVVQPVADMLRSGTRVTKAFAEAIQWLKIKLENDSNPSRLVALIDSLINPATGRYYTEGEVRKDEKLARTLDIIAENPEDFYNDSQLFRDIKYELESAGSIINETDLINYKVSMAEPIVVNLINSGKRIITMPPPSSGAIVAFVLNVLDGYGMSASAKDKLTDYVNFYHRLLEALKFGDAQRSSSLCDPDFDDVDDWVTNMTSKSFAETVRSKISNDSVLEPGDYFYQCHEWETKGGTTHISIVDSEGNAVVLTSTINIYFGSRIRGNRTGIIYNNQMDDFAKPNDTDPPLKNFIESGKRPASSAAPTFVTDADGNLELATGASGGSKIVATLSGTLARRIFLNDTVKQMTDAFRFYQWCSKAEYDSAFSPPPMKLIELLKDMGHKFNETTLKTVVEAISVSANGRNKWQASGDAHRASRPNGL